MTIAIWHHPAGGTSRDTLAMIRASGEAPVVIESPENPPSRKRPARLIAAAGLTLREALRRKGAPSGAKGLEDPDPADDQRPHAMLAHPILINRPFVQAPEGTRLRRPSARDLLENPGLAFVKEDGEAVRRDEASRG